MLTKFIITGVTRGCFANIGSTSEVKTDIMTTFFFQLIATEGPAYHNISCQLYIINDFAATSNTLLATSFCVGGIN